MRQFLEFQGHNVDVAADHRTAIRKADDLQPELLVCDFKIRGHADGVDVATELQSQFDIPVIMVTGHRLSQAREKARDTDVRIAAYRRKPISLSELASLIESVSAKAPSD